jgi:ribose transport system substrate-binding protein
MKKSFIKKVAVIVSVLVILTMVAACSSTEQPAETESASSEAPVSEESSASVEASEISEGADLSEWDNLTIPEPKPGEQINNIDDYDIYQKPEEGKQLTFALLLFSRGYEWMVGLEDQFVRSCEERGITPVTLDAQGSDETQLNQIQDCITKGYDAIILTPNSSDGLIPGVEAANEAGVVLTTTEGSVEGGVVPLEVKYAREDAGALCADFLADCMGDEGKTLICKGAINSVSAEERKNGYEQEIDAHYPNISYIEKNCEWLAVEAQKATTDVLMANPDLAGIYSVNDEMQTGVEAGLKESGRLVPVGEEGHVYRVGIDGTPLALERVRQGTQTATCVQDPFQFAEASVDYTLRFLQGEDIPTEVWIQPYIVTQANADNPDLWGNYSE